MKKVLLILGCLICLLLSSCSGRAVAAAYTGRAGRKSEIVMDGGTLSIEWRETDNHIYMTGPAAFVFDGELEISKLQTA